MGLSTDVTLPRSVVPRFPNRCVRCNFEGPSGRVRLTTHGGWPRWPWWWWTRRVSVEVPCCFRCHTAIRRQRWLRTIGTTAAFLVAAGITWSYVGELPRPYRRWAALGWGLIFLAPLIGLDIFFPPVVDITAHADTVDYEFRDPQFAREFAQQNGVGPSNARSHGR